MVKELRLLFLAITMDDKHTHQDDPKRCAGKVSEENRNPAGFTGSETSSTAPDGETMTPDQNKEDHLHLNDEGRSQITNDQDDFLNGEDWKPLNQ